MSHLFMAWTSGYDKKLSSTTVILLIIASRRKHKHYTTNFDVFTLVIALLLYLGGL